MAIHDLPAELLTDIFEQVVYDDSLVDPFHPTSMSLSRWERRPTKPDWILMSPNEDVNAKQMRAYAVTKVRSAGSARDDSDRSGNSRLLCLPANNGTELPTIYYSALFSCRISSGSLRCASSLIAMHGWGGT